MLEAPKLLVGIFVGGSGSRMGGVPKGLLQTRTETGEVTLIQRALAELSAALPAVEVTLVGKAAAYSSLGLRVIDDAPPGVGPLGGLLGLLLDAEHGHCTHAVALACDLPFVSRELLARLAAEKPDAEVLVAQAEGVRNPLFARYRTQPSRAAARTVLSAGTRSLQAVLDELGEGVSALSLSAAEAESLRDWDTPEDVRAGRY